MLRKYSKIDRYGKSRVNIKDLKEITISEKLDGANASFELEYNETLNKYEIVCFSRNQRLSPENTLRGFYDYVQENIDVNKLVFGEIYYGEWLVRHSLDYGDNYNRFYLFDIYSKDLEKYLELVDISSQAYILGLPMPEVFYHGEPISIEHIQSFVGKSTLGEVGEGVIVKAYKNTDRFGKQIMLKFISDKFAEVADRKKHKVKRDVCILDEFVENVVTEARVEKIIHKLIDEGKLKEDLDITDMGEILKQLGSSIYQDVIDEELDLLLNDVKRKVGKRTPAIVRSVMKFD